ncbi:MAG: hypothetical protein LBO74_09165 [Candidatus Symbiothrix sp.]|nr:hypothetical protein [Candidatus Symbiothrix sp.]
MEKESETLFEKFLKENFISHKSEIIDIAQRLKTIGAKTGAREIFFKSGEGKLGDGVCALYDCPNHRLRLYCIRYGTQIIVLGGGGQKNVRTLQEDPKLKKENYFLRELSKQITEKIKNAEIKYSKNGLDFEEDFEIDLNIE